MLHIVERSSERSQNPFTPDFGQEPTCHVGHDALHQSLLSGLRNGPSDNRFTTLLLGPRGSGKTVTLTKIRGAVENSGWIVLPLDAGNAGIDSRLDQMISWAHERYEDMPEVNTTIETKRNSTGFRFWGFDWQREVAQKISPKWSTRYKLTTLAEHAAINNTGVLLLIDELQHCDRDELRRLALDIQHITKSDKLPLAFIGAGLSEMHHTLLEDKKITFFQRCNQFDMPSLSSVDIMHCLLQTVQQAGGSFEGNALDILTKISGTLPYRMQLAGFNAWQVVDAPDQPISEKAAELSEYETNRWMYKKVALPTWASLNQSEQAVLRTISDLGGVASPNAIAEHTKLSPSTLVNVEEHLLNAGCIKISDEDLLELSGIITLKDITNITERVDRFSSSYKNKARSYSTVMKPRCAADMPRVKSRCILTAGHKGGHRSK